MSHNPHMYYLVENEIVFNPVNFTLKSRLTQRECKLKPTASACLLLLIKNHDHLISQKELLEFAWGENHREVTFNAYYQSILSLRTAFKDVGLDKQVITTIIRKGLIIKNDVTVKEISLPYEKVNSEVYTLSGPSESKYVSNIAINFRTFLSIVEVLLVILTIIISAMLIINYTHNKNTNFFSGYILLNSKNEGCKYYINGDATDDSPHNEIISKFPEICNGGRSIYITAYPETTTSSVLTCKDPITGSAKNMCVTIFLHKRDK